MIEGYLVRNLTGSKVSIVGCFIEDRLKCINYEALERDGETYKQIIEISGFFQLE